MRPAGLKLSGRLGSGHAVRLEVLDGGGPLGKTKRISAQGIADTRNDVAAYVIVRAESHEAAARMFENHPHFSLFPGEAVEIMERLPVPTQPPG